ncbi:MAG: alpha/beta hydrolase [Dehalococcoidia bacterium]
MPGHTSPETLVVQAGAATVCVGVRGEGPPVVMHPSLGRGGSDFDDLAGRLAAAGFRAAAMDPRGVGRSRGPADGLTLHDLASDIAAVVGALGDDPAHLIGHAYGNRVVRCAAADHPELVRSVTLLAAGGLVPPEPEAARALARCFELDRPLAERLADVRSAFFAGESDPAVWTDGWWPETARLERAATQATPLEDWWTAGSAPVLVVQGLEDRVAPPANGRDIKERLGDRAELVEVSPAGHALLPEQPEAIAEAVVRFLRRQ